MIYSESRKTVAGFYTEGADFMAVKYAQQLFLQ
jgi:hypothetical protein